MLSYCLKCTKNKESKNQNVVKSNAFIKMLSVIVKNQNLVKSEKLENYYLA